MLEQTDNVIVRLALTAGLPILINWLGEQRENHLVYRSLTEPTALCRLRVHYFLLAAIPVAIAALFIAIISPLQPGIMVLSLLLAILGVALFLGHSRRMDSLLKQLDDDMVKQECTFQNGIGYVTLLVSTVILTVALRL